MDEFFDKVDNLLHNLTMINIDEVKDEVINNLKVTVNNYLLSNELNDEYKNKMCFLIKKYCISKLKIIQILFNSFDYWFIIKWIDPTIFNINIKYNQRW